MIVKVASSLMADRRWRRTSKVMGSSSVTVTDAPSSGVRTNDYCLPRRGPNPASSPAPRSRGACGEWRRRWPALSLALSEVDPDMAGSVDRRLLARVYHERGGGNLHKRRTIDHGV